MSAPKIPQESSSTQTRAARLSRVQYFAAGVLLVGVLYWTRDLLVPMALAILISFLLAPLVDKLRRARLPKAVAVSLVTVSATALVVTLIGLFSAQVLDLMTELPSYKKNLLTKLDSLRSSANQPFAEVSKTIEDIQTHITTQPTGLDVPGKGTPASPVTATLVESQPTIVTIAKTLIDKFLAPLAVAGMVFVLVFFFLLESDIALVRLRYLIRRLHLGITDETIDDTMKRLGTYLRMQLIVNLSYGAMVTFAMWAFGVPNFALWGMSAALLRYVPYIGPLLAAALPIMLSIAYFPGWSRPMWITLCFLGAETITNGLLEPWLYGTSTGVSSLGVVIAAFFWYWLWGPIGMILAMPMTICIVVVGKQIPMLAPFAYLLSGDAKSRRKFEATQEPPEPTLFDPPKPLDTASPAASVTPTA